MKDQRAHKRYFFDLNHPADFHFFKHLMNHLKGQGHAIKVVARNKECLQMLLEDAGIPYINRGRGKHTLFGKYIYALWILFILMFALIRFRPTIALSLSSPYLAVLTRLLGITCVTYDDTDKNPRLLPLIKRSTYLLSPATYPYTFHKRHYHLPALKELAYLHPKYITTDEEKSGLFLRITRTDSVHHSHASSIDIRLLRNHLDSFEPKQSIYLSCETDCRLWNNSSVLLADPLDIHTQLSKCKAFWGNSATMAAEAAVLGIPAVFVSAEQFTYLDELEAYGLLYYHHPDDLQHSLDKLDTLMAGDPPKSQFTSARNRLLSEKMNMTAFMIWFIENLPRSAETLDKEPGYIEKFIQGNS